MCGITGIVALNGGRVDPAVLQKMNDIQAHRGPDGEGFVFASRGADRFEHARMRHTGEWGASAPVSVGLGHRRLSILDLSDRGAQPMAVGDGRTWIVFNGEIYNHRELRDELTGHGYRFTTTTDTEVLLQAYRHWGADCLPRLTGMYAFAIWDGDRGELFCARDRLGIKPFYYATPKGYLIFGSEMKALLAFPGVEPVPDDAAVLGFLIHANCDYGERTVLREITSLPAAHSLTVDLATGRWTTKRYWELAPRPTNGTGDREHIKHLHDLLVDTTCSHLISDVRAGSCLSGGLDSSSIVALIGKVWREQPEAATAVGDRLYTFTSCYEHKEIDERQYAQAAADASGATSHLVFPSAGDFWDAFPQIAWHQDMPFGSLSYYAQWRVMRAAKEAGVKVLLDGQGGDEVFGGYAKFRYAYLASLIRSGRLPTLTRELGATILQRDKYVLDLRRGYRYLPKGMRRLLGVDSMLQTVVHGDWGNAVASESSPATRWWRYAAAGNTTDFAGTFMQRMQIDDIVTDTLPQLLRMEDRSSMAFSLEARVPLLDHRVVEYGLSLPDHLKVRNGWSKVAVRRAMAGLVPEDVRWRKTKLGFAAPDRHWLTKDLRPQVTELLNGELRCERYVDPDALRRWYRSPEADRANDESYLGLFRVLSLEMWMRQFNVT
jgi:asparagine synthase (glutamine-hydrolysing)